MGGELACLSDQPLLILFPLLICNVRFAIMKKEGKQVQLSTGWLGLLAELAGQGCWLEQWVGGKKMS